MKENSNMQKSPKSRFSAIFAYKNILKKRPANFFFCSKMKKIVTNHHQIN